MERVEHPAAVALAPLLLALVTGCGGGQMPLAHVSGVVTLDGSPLTGAKVTFLPQAGPAASGALDAQGRFELSTYQRGDGAVLGSHTAIVTPIVQGVLLEPGAPPKAPPREQDAVPAVYHRAESSPLHYTVKKDGNDFELKLRSS